MLREDFRISIFASDETLLCTRNDMTQFVVEEGEYCLNTTLPISTEAPAIKEGMLIGFDDIDGNFVLYEIKEVAGRVPSNSVKIYAEHAAMCELLDEAVQSCGVSNGSAGAAVMKVLENTRYSLLSDGSSGTATTTFYYKSVWECLIQISERWKCNFKFHWVVQGTKIASRHVSVVQRLGADRGKRFEVWRDLESVDVIYSDTNVVTRVYGRGRGEEVGVTDSGDPTYGRRINIAEVEWSVEKGDPVDKPLGQEYIEDIEATAKYGRCGRPRTRVVIFESETDTEALAVKTYDYLQANKEPLFSANISAYDLESKYGFDHETVRTGDTVYAIVDEVGLYVAALVNNISRDYLDPDSTRFSMGNHTANSVDLQAKLLVETQRARVQAAFGADIAMKNTGLLQGMIDVVETTIMSSSTKFYTTEDGSFVFETADGTKAVMITGAGILVASSKTGAEWDWKTAITGDGMVASLITSGVLQANLIRILGNDCFYWDAGNIVCQDPENTLRQIRIGCYNGKNYGIAFTQDGGITWQNALDFNGLNISATGYTRNIVQPDEPSGVFFIGDIWTKYHAPTTWDEMSSFTWDEVSQFSWNYLLGTEGDPPTYIWNGQRWVPTSSVSVEDVSNRVSTTEAQLIVQSQQILQRVTEEQFLDLEDRVTGTETFEKELDDRIYSAESLISQLSNEIISKVSETRFNELTGRLETDETIISQLSTEINAKVSADGVVQAILLSKEGLKIDVSLLDINGFVSLNGDTTINADGTLFTANMVATNAAITGTFSAPHTHIGSQLYKNQNYDGIFFSSKTAFDADYIKACIGRDSYGDYHFSTTDGALYLDTNYGDIVLINGSSIYISAYDSDETLVLGRDLSQSDYQDLCVFPDSSTRDMPRGNCGTPAHPWDTCTADQFFSDNSIRSRSSRELKKDIKPLEDMGWVIDHLSPVEFRYRYDKKERLHYGLIFEDTESVAPILCDRTSEKPEDCRIAYEPINLILLKEVQSLRKRVNELEKIL